KGARRIRVDPMTKIETAELLSNRFHARRPVDHTRIARIAPFCGGLPLAIIVLAEHVATQPDTVLSEFTNQLDRRQLITDIGDDGDGSANLQTFFTWSYDALGVPERRLFRLLGLHPGPDISLDAACAYDGRGRAKTIRGMSVLVGAHLIEQPEVLNRYR